MKRGTGANKLRATYENGGTRVVMAGAIDEFSDLDDVFSRVKGDAVINMKAVDRVNSMGVHLWIPVIAKASSKGRIVIEEISYGFVFNANAVANLFGNAEVRSCLAPYRCESCNEDFMVTVTADEVAQAGKAAPAKRCPKCTKAMQFEELDGYFSFFKTNAAR